MYYLRWPDSQWCVYGDDMSAVHLYCMRRGSGSVHKLSYDEVKKFIAKPNWKMWYGAEVKEEFSKRELLNAMTKWVEETEERCPEIKHKSLWTSLSTWLKTLVKR